ncbi:MAG: TRAP transporter small permease [Burkholderiaceae bacterium]|nr:TRAP transporter small permease [Burkholderiaceae bacterium]
MVLTFKVQTRGGQTHHRYSRTLFGRFTVRHLILTLDRYITSISWTVASFLLAVISCLGLWQVVARFVLSQPSTWTEEIMRRLLIWCVMLGVVVALRQGVLVCVDLALRMTKGRWHQAVRLFVTLATASFLATIVYFGVQLAYRVRFQTFASIDISIAWAYAAVPVGAMLAIIAVIAHHLDPKKPDALAMAAGD